MTHFIGRRQLLKTGALAGVAGMAMPAILRASNDPYVIAHLTPRTGFLGPMGEYAVMAVDLAVEEINAAGGINGRPLNVIKEDSVNPQTATTKAERLVERPDVAMVLGEISSASALSIAQVTARANKLFINTGANSDTLRGKDCRRTMFHTEAQNVMYVNAEGQYFLQNDMVKDKTWFILSSDYAFGHDLREGAHAFLERHGGSTVGDELIPTDATDFSSHLLSIRSRRPDVVVLNLAGTSMASFLKQYGEFGLDIPLGGFDYNSSLAWATGAEDFKGTWPCIWTHQVQTDGSQAFARAFQAKYGKPAENQAYADYIALRIAAEAITRTGGTDTAALIAYLEDPATDFDILKDRRGRFDPSTHQLLQEVYAVTALDPSEVEDQWDIFTTSGPLPAPDVPLEELVQGAVGGACTF
ncbi:ABC transporter substrate-binding protein [Paenirhodobacter populi]|uniref:ABC transporter substrate-binding protein n=1 Tax=Paenirhodobacter populi TaxID=2306993 RepID=A0A443K5X0_9RHOB|nr:ABC transporter substrate-binding protein [Sinirhodobacter populi]RWR06390.1 ABC transporter substrate-binding protein [Sinirhodobacter populi]RWR09105.1 ABC transporter substrate-binding protein [Sinirhodobacter populi]RWR28150.1 ABC transporter substrate-binding protein [Sinirhodobacter populi]